jgi:phosphatidylglycerol:prolipoprotein diacylglycerol transferase
MLGAIGTGALVARKTQEPLKLDSLQRWGLFLGAFCGSFLGAKLPYLLFNALHNVPDAGLFDSGKTILGGMVGGYFGVEAVKFALEIKVKTGDSFAVPVAASIAVGRLACFFGGCCFGIPTSLPWAVRFGDGIPRHPTQIYEFFFHGGMAVLLWNLRERGLFQRQLIKLYILSYLVYRFLTEFIRPEPRVLQGLTPYQLAALAMIPLFAWLWRLDSPAYLAQKS